MMRIAVSAVVAASLARLADDGQGQGQQFQMDMPPNMLFNPQQNGLLGSPEAFRIAAGLPEVSVPDVAPR